MANLFFVFTPLQLLVAQQIVHQEGLKDCILIEGYVMPPKNRHFLEIFDFIEIEGMWKKKIIFPEIAQWDGLKIAGIKDAKHAYNNYKFLRRIVEENNVETIYLGEIQNQAYRFTDILFSHLGYKIAYFEDGLGHYMNRSFTPNNTLSTRLKIWIRDIFYYLPIYHVRFAKWRYNVNIPNYSELHIYKRYSVIPVFHEKYDVHIKVQPLFSKKVNNYINEITSNNISKENILLMTDPVSEFIPHKYFDLYFKVIQDNIKKIDKDKVLYIKYHPRDTDNNRNRLENMLKDMGREYIILGKEINIPIELLLQKMRFEKIFIFNAATYFYNGYLYPKCDFVPLLPELYMQCQKNGSGRIKELEHFISTFESGLNAFMQ